MRTEQVTAFFDQARQRSREMAEQTARDAEAMRGAFVGAFDDAAKGPDKIADALAALRRDVETFHMSDVQRRLFDFEALGPDAGDLAQFQTLR